MSGTESSQTGPSKALFDLKLTEHSLHGGYVYIPFKFRHFLPVDSNERILLKSHRGEVPIFWKLDKNGRLMSDPSHNDVKNLRDWFEETSAGPSDILRFGQNENRKDRIYIELIPKAQIRYQRPPAANQSLVSVSSGLLDLAKSIGMKNMFKLASIGTRFEEILKEGVDKSLDANSRVNPPISQCVKLISHDPRLMRFFDGYWESHEFKRIFSYRPVQLIIDTDDPEPDQVKRFTLVDFQPAKPVDVTQLEKIRDIQRANLELKYHSLVEEYDLLIVAFGALMADIEKISSGDDAAKAKLLGEILDLVNETIRKPEIKDELVGLIKDLLHDPIPMLQALMGMYLPDEIKKGTASLEHILKVCRLTHDQYGRVIDSLSDIRILSGAYRFHWCPFHPQDPFYSLTIMPTARFTGTCPHCGQQLSSVGWSMINSDLFHFMRHKDGLMTIAIAWYAQKNGWAWKSNQVIDGQEIDLQLLKQGTIIHIETKTLMFDNDYSALRRKTLEELRKFERKRTIIKPGPGSKNFWLFVVNMPHDLLATLKLRSDADVSVISIDDFKDTVEKSILAEK